MMPPPLCPGMDKQRRAASEKRRQTAAKAAAIRGIRDKQTLQEIAPLLQFAAPRGMALPYFPLTSTPMHELDEDWLTVEPDSDDDNNKQEQPHHQTLHFR